MKKILIFSLAYYPSHVSGAEASVKEITDRIIPSDIEFHLVTLRFDTTLPVEELIGNVHVHRVGFGPSYLSKICFVPLAVIKAMSLKHSLGISGYWTMMTYMLFPVAILRLLGSKVPHALTLQDGDPYEKVFERAHIRPFVFLLDIGFKSAKVIQPISRYLAEWPKKRNSQAKVVLVHNGANPKDLKESVPESEVTEIKKKLGKKDDDIYLVNTARLVHQKGNDDTIRALLELPVNVKLLLVGGGEDEAMLKTLSKELGLEDRVIFTGQVDRSEVTKYRLASDIFVGPSRSEGLGNAFLSAMASRLPVVATQEGGLADFLFDAKKNPDIEATGWAVIKDNSQSIAAAVKDILANPEKVKTVTECARRMVLEKYDWDKIAKEMKEKVFSELI